MLQSYGFEKFPVKIATKASLRKRPWISGGPQSTALYMLKQGPPPIPPQVVFHSACFEEQWSRGILKRTIFFERFSKRAFVKALVISNVEHCRSCKRVVP